MRWYGRPFMRRWGFRRWRPTADSATVAHAIHKRRMRQRALRIFSKMGLRVIIDPNDIPTSSLVPPFVISGPFVVEGFLDQLTGFNPLPVYTSSWYTEAPTVVSTWDAWNVVRSQSVNFPLFWNRMY